MKMNTVDCARFLVFHARCGCTFHNSARVRVGGSILPNTFSVKSKDVIEIATHFIFGVILINSEIKVDSNSKS